ncbi:MAG: SoxR reducing system RseC family protein [Prevotellaceae bacterium]|nr:SoxR reducing system RseC family protein [Candidatus Colivivens caballi]
MKGQIEHSGTVESIEGGYIHVRITQSSACAGCTARSLCQSAESKDKIVEVEATSSNPAHAAERRNHPDGRSFLTGNTDEKQPENQQGIAVGDSVIVYGSSEMGHTAVVLAFVVPLVLMVGTIASGIKVMELSEPASIGLAFLALATYYFALWTQRARIQKNFVWRIKGYRQ